MKKGSADLPLHSGHAPRWLFDRMTELSGAIAEMVVEEHSRKEFLRRLSNPYFFQSFACVIGFDWHSSGATTTTIGALKEAGLKDLGIKVLGGKGKASRETPEQIEALEEGFLKRGGIEELQRSSKMAAKVDSGGVQDGFHLYHHSFIVTEDGEWAVVQQGMNDSNGYARRYHWIDEEVESFVEEPEEAICCDTTAETLNLVDMDSEKVRNCCVDLVNDSAEEVIREIKAVKNSNSLLRFTMPEDHGIDLSRYSSIRKAHEFQPNSFEELVGLEGMGPKTLRALALVSELVYGEEASWEDPAKYSFAHGGKDGTPYPVDRDTYDESIRTLRDALEGAEVEREEKKGAIKRLNKFAPE